MKKIWNFIKNIFEWIVAILAVVSGVFIIKFIYNKYKNSDSEEQAILNEIEKNEQLIKELEKNTSNNIDKEEALHQEQIKIQEKIDKLKEEYIKKQQEFADKKEDINNSTHDDNIDYINKKYK